MFRVLGFGCRVQGSGFRVQGSGFRFRARRRARVLSSGRDLPHVAPATC